MCVTLTKRCDTPSLLVTDTQCDVPHMTVQLSLCSAVRERRTDRETCLHAFNGMKHAFGVLAGSWIYPKCEHSQEFTL